MISMKKLRICVAGATGWAGSELCKAIVFDDNLELVSGVSRKFSGANLSKVIGIGDSNTPIFSTVSDSLINSQYDILVEYTKPNIAKENTIEALNKGVSVVIGTSGLTQSDLNEIEEVAIKNDTSVLAVGNFSLTAVLLQKFSEIAAKYIPNYEIIDYAKESKVDVPSGTARQLAEKLNNSQESTIHTPNDKLIGPAETRGARIHGVQVHSVRLPGHTLGVDSIFGLEDEKLIISHQSGNSAVPYVKGAIIAINKVQSFKGLKKGLDSVMDI